MLGWNYKILGFFLLGFLKLKGFKLTFHYPLVVSHGDGDHKHEIKIVNIKEDNH